MAARPDAQLNLTSILRQAPGSDDEVFEEGLLDPPAALLEADGLRIPAPLAWSLTVRRTGGDDEDFLLEGEVEGSVLLECRRCVRDVTVEVHSDLFFLMRHNPSQTEPLRVEGDDEIDDDVLVFGPPVVDFAPLLLQFLAIDVPLTALCREDCKGLSIDGVDLNEHPDHVPAGERPVEPDSPFSALKDLDLQE
jgi:uncharacterized protein